MYYPSTMAFKFNSTSATTATNIQVDTIVLSPVISSGVVGGQIHLIVVTVL